MIQIVKILRRNLPIVEIAQQLGVTRYKVYLFLKKIGIVDVREFIKEQKFDQLFFQEINSEEKAYLFGFLCADGYVFVKDSIFRVQVYLSKVGIEHLNKWHKIIKSCQNITRCLDFITSYHNSKIMC